MNARENAPVYPSSTDPETIVLASLIPYSNVANLNLSVANVRHAFKCHRL